MKESPSPYARRTQGRRLALQTGGHGRHGITLLSAHTIAAELRDGALSVLSVQGLPVMRQWFAVRHREKRLLPAALPS